MTNRRVKARAPRASLPKTPRLTSPAAAMLAGSGMSPSSAMSMDTPVSSPDQGSLPGYRGGGLVSRGRSPIQRKGT